MRGKYPRTARPTTPYRDGFYQNTVRLTKEQDAKVYAAATALKITRSALIGMLVDKIDAVVEPVPARIRFKS